MLPAWSRNAIPLVFISLIYGLLSVLLVKPDVWGQGSDMSLITIYFAVSYIRTAQTKLPLLQS